MHVAELIASEPPKARWLSTGLKRLDEIVGGLRPGQMWVITGHPAAGKSTLLLQLVFELAVKHGVHTDCALTDPLDIYLARSRLAAQATRRPIAAPNSEIHLNELQPREEHRLEKLCSAPLSVSAKRGYALPRWAPVEGRDRCFAVDDPEFRRSPVLDQVARLQLRDLADLGFVLVTVPRSHCLVSSNSGEHLREEWSSVADVIVETVVLPLGEAVIRVWQNRRGPTGDARVVLQPHFARFADSAL